jgi:hypothetical protein
MRYVKDRLVLRLHSSPSESLMEAIRDQFSDLAIDGEFKVTTALPAETNEPEWAELPRLVFRFNRRDHGRLRKLIDLINADF